MQVLDVPRADEQMTEGSFVLSESFRLSPEM